MGEATSYIIDGVGALENCEVEIKPLTIFIGKNNIGKSYYALVVHSINQSILSFMSNHMFTLYQRRNPFKGFSARAL